MHSAQMLAVLSPAKDRGLKFRGCLTCAFWAGAFVYREGSRRAFLLGHHDPHLEVDPALPSFHFYHYNLNQQTHYCEMVLEGVHNISN